MDSLKYCDTPCAFHITINEARYEKNLSSWFPTRSDTNRAVQTRKMARGLKYRIKLVEGLYYIAKTNVLISCAVTAQLICVFVSTYLKKKNRFSHEL